MERAQLCTRILPMSRKVIIIYTFEKDNIKNKKHIEREKQKLIIHHRRGDARFQYTPPKVDYLKIFFFFSFS